LATEEYQKVYLYRRIVQAKVFIDSHFADSIDVSKVADEAFFSKFHFLRLFKKIYGKTPHQYLIAVRIEKAMQLLNEENPVSDVCYSVGFESLSSFSSLFKRMVGSTPSAYQAKRHHLKLQIRQTPLNFVPGCFAYQHGWIAK
jgi:AraC-like DNA-binding protein